MMASQIQINFITKTIIKPSCSTPKAKKLINLSLLDQLNFSLSTPIILFFSNNGTIENQQTKSKRLTSSLSKALDLFYPVAGTIKNNSVIDCDDQGVDYIEANISCTLSQLLNFPNVKILEELITIDLNPLESPTGAKIQVNFFSCGGVAIGVSLSPKIGDATALLTFIMVWAASSFNNSNIDKIPQDLIPNFIGDSIIPSLSSSMQIPMFSAQPPPQIQVPSKCKTVRFVFNEDKILLLQQQGSSDAVPKPSRVEAVTALLWKRLIALSKSDKDASKERKCVVSHAVNYRKRFVPPLPERYIGNLSGRYIAEAKENDLSIQELVGRLRNGLNQTNDLITNALASGNVLKTVMEYTGAYLGLHGSDDVDFYNFRSLCGFPLYEADFGWGTPSWVIVTNPVLKNYVLLTDTKGSRGIEAWVSLDEEGANFIEKDKEILSYAQVNPLVEV